MAEEVVIVSDFNGKGYGFAKGIYDYINLKEDRKFPIRLTEIQKKDFRDGEFKLRVKENIRERHCFLVHDSNKNPSEWFTELCFALNAISYSSDMKITAVLPYMRFARQDRKDESRVSMNAKAVADVLGLYADRGMTADLHNSSMQGFFDIPFDNLYSFPSLINHLQANYQEMLENLVVVSPDLGGGKRAESLVKRLTNKGIGAEVALGHKSREMENEVKKITIIGDVAGKNCLIVDDIIDTGNTMLKTCEALGKNGAKSVYAYGTHGLFTEGTEKFKCFDKVLVGDTLSVPDFSNCEKVSLINLFGEAVYRTVVGESLSSLFDDEKPLRC